MAFNPLRNYSERRVRTDKRAIRKQMETFKAAAHMEIAWFWSFFLS